MPITLPEYLDRLPPANIEAEQAILGAIFIEPDILPDVSRQIDASDFYRSTHTDIFTACQRFHAAHPTTPLDLLSIRAALEADGKLDEIGGPAYLATLIDLVPTAANYEYHCGLVREAARKRRFLDQCLEAIAALHNPRRPFQETFLEFNAQVRSLDYEPVQWVRTENGQPRGIIEREYVSMLEGLGFRQTNYNGRGFGRIIGEDGKRLDDVDWYKNICVSAKDAVKDAFAESYPSLWELLLKKHKFDDRVMTSLNIIDHREFVRDDAQTCYLYFQNGAARIYPDRVQFLKYSELPGYIWQSSVNSQHYHGQHSGDCCLDLDAEQRAARVPDFQRLIELVSSGLVNIDDRTSHAVNNRPVFEYAFGHALWQYNDPINMRCIINIDDDPGEMPEGRRCKGLFTYAMRVIRGVTDEDAGKQTYTVVHEDGKAFAGGFKFQRVMPTTRILIIDDVDEKTVTFEQFFSAITEGLVTEAKGARRYAFTKATTPKIIFNTNAPFFGHGRSSTDRLILLPFNDFFARPGQRPKEIFGRNLFYDWDNQEWARFHDYVISLIQTVMRTDPLHIPEADLTVFNANRLLLELPENAVRFFDDMKDNEDYSKDAVIAGLEENGVQLGKRGTFRRLLLTYEKLRGRRLKTNTKDNRYKSNGTEYICFETTMFDQWQQDVIRRVQEEEQVF